MISLDIVHLMQLRHDFQGVFPLDRLPNPIMPNTCFIFNSQASNFKGQHWLAVRVNERNQVFYYDPLAFPPIASVCNHLLRCCPNKVFFLPESTQELFTPWCGFFCIYYLYMGRPTSSQFDLFELINKLTELIRIKRYHDKQ